MNRFTDTYREEIESAKKALVIAIPLILKKEATVKIENNKDRITSEFDGNMMTELYMLAMATAELLNDMDDEDAMTVFLAAVELERERQREQK